MCAEHVHTPFFIQIYASTFIFFAYRLVYIQGLASLTKLFSYIVALTFKNTAIITIVAAKIGHQSYTYLGCLISRQEALHCGEAASITLEILGYYACQNYL